MAKQITDEMIKRFNDHLEDQNSIIRLKGLRGIEVGVVDIVLTDDRYIDNFIINLTDEFHNYLRNYFNSFDINIRYNNVKSCFWSTDKV